MARADLDRHCYSVGTVTRTMVEGMCEGPAKEAAKAKMEALSPLPSSPARCIVAVFATNRTWHPPSP
jgi:hypothetical protein